MADEQILTARVTIPPAPSTSRGVPLRFSLNSQGQSLFYGNGSNIYIRSLDGKGTQPLKVCSLHTSLVTTVTLSPDDQCCASGDQDGNVILWSAQDTKMQRYKNRPFNSGPVLDVAWSDDSERVVAVGEGKNTFGAVYSSSTGTSLGLINGHTKNILSADFRKARPYRIATGSSDMLMCFFEGPPFKFVQSQKKHTGVVNIVRFSPDGQLLASASADKTICIYNATDGTAIGTIASGHTGSIYSLAFWRETPESSWCIVTASADKTCRVFPATDSAAARQVINFNSSEVEFMQMGVGTATGSPTAVSIGLNGDVHVLDLTDAKSSKPCCILRGHQRTISAMATNRGKSSFFTFSVDGKILRWKSSFENSSMNIDLRQSSCIAAPTVKNVSTALCISENAVLCAGNDESCATIRIDGDAESVTIHEKISGSATGSAYVTKLNTAVIITTSSIILNPDVPTKKHTIRVPYSPLSVTAIHNEIWVGSAKDHNIYVYEVKADGKADLVETLADVHRGNVSALATSTSNALVASGDTNREILIWDPVTRKPLPRARDMVFHASRVTCLAFLSTEAEGNGTSESILVSGSSDATIRVWNIHRKGEAHLTVSRAHPGGVTALVGISASEFSSSGSDATVRLWQLEEKHLKELNK